MPRRARRTCATCGGHSSVVGEISWGDNCRDCGQRNLQENIVGISTKTGAAHRRWLRGMERYVQRARLDIDAPNP